jgi:hypothetical protein
MNSLKEWLTSSKRIPLSFLDPKIFCEFVEVCITLKHKNAENCKLCLEYERSGKKNPHKDMLKGMYESGS